MNILRAPEIINHYYANPSSSKPYKAKRNAAASDIWSFGCTLCEMITGYNPWELSGGLVKKSTREQVEYMLENANSLVNYIPECREELKLIIRHCFNLNPSKRPTAAQILNDPFFSIKYSEDKYVVEEKNFILNEIKKEMDLAIKKKAPPEIKEQSTLADNKEFRVSESSSFSALSDLAISSNSPTNIDLQEEEFNQQFQHSNN